MHKSIPIQCLEINNNKNNLKKPRVAIFGRRREEKLNFSQLQREVAINRNSLRWHSRATRHGAPMPLCYLSFSCFLGWHGHPTWHGAPMPLSLDSKSTFWLLFSATLTCFSHFVQSNSWKHKKMSYKRIWSKECLINLYNLEVLPKTADMGGKNRV